MRAAEAGYLMTRMASGFRSALAFARAPDVTLPIAGSASVFPVNRVFCVGRNYAEHAREMGHDSTREPPFFFMKPASAVVASNATIPYPSATDELHYEVELVIALEAGGAGLTATQSEACVFGFAVGLDLTRRDLQRTAKAAGRPWEAAKAFDGSAPCSPLERGRSLATPTAGISLDVDGERRQSGHLGQLIWSIPEILAELSSLFTLAPGDLVFTGTPSGVGGVRPGSRLSARVEGLPGLDVMIGPRSGSGT